MDPVNSGSRSQNKNIPVVLPSSSIRIQGKFIKKGFMSYDRKNKQTAIATLMNLQTISNRIITCLIMQKKN